MDATATPAESEASVPAPAPPSGSAAASKAGEEGTSVACQPSRARRIRPSRLPTQSQIDSLSQVARCHWELPAAAAKGGGTLVIRQACVADGMIKVCKGQAPALTLHVTHSPKGRSAAKASIVCLCNRAVCRCHHKHGSRDKKRKHTHTKEETRAKCRDESGQRKRKSHGGDPGAKSLCLAGGDPAGHFKLHSHLRTPTLQVLDPELIELMGGNFEAAMRREANAASLITSHVMNRALISNRRETMSRSDVALYTSLTSVGHLSGPVLQARYAERQLMSVKRCAEPTTTNLRRLCEVGFNAMVRRMRAMGMQEDDQGTFREARRASILTTALWRQVGGTVLLAAELGFFEAFGPEEKIRVVQTLTRLRQARHQLGNFMTYHNWHEGDRGQVQKIVNDFREQRGTPLNLEEFLCPGYAPPRMLWAVLRSPGRSEPAWRCEQGDKKWVATLKQTLGSASLLWHQGMAEALLHIADVGVSWKDGCYSLRDLPYFGEGKRGDSKRRTPGFHSKELLQDLLDMPWVWRGGRAALRDTQVFSPSGPGARQGLVTVLGLPRDTELDHESSLKLMRRLMPQVMALQQVATSQHGRDEKLQRVEELHDLQYVLCEMHKLLSPQNMWPRRGLAIRAANPAAAFQRYRPKTAATSRYHMPRRAHRAWSWTREPPAAMLPASQDTPAWTSQKQRSWRRSDAVAAFCMSSFP